MRSGLYPAKSFPLHFGQEASGTIVRLPTDPSVLSQDQFKLRGLVEGAKVIVVGILLFFKNIHYVYDFTFLHFILHRTTTKTLHRNAPQGSVGTFAEYISVPWSRAFALPSSISLRDGAALFIQGLTALTFSTESHNIQSGETVLIHAIAGGLGLIFSQIAKARGATVIGTTSSPEKAELAKKYGADHVILYTQEDTVKRVLEITNGEGVHAVFDGVGKDT